MVDYYSALLRAVTAPDAGDAQWRRGMYDRARQMLAARLRERSPPVRQAEITAELSALDAAIDRIEAEMSWTDQDGDLADIGKIKVDTVNPEREPIAKPVQLRGTTWLVLAVVVAALGAGGLVFWPHKAQMSAPPATKSETSNAAPKPAPVAKVATSKDGDLAAGIDGGSSDPDQGYVFRRQSTFYRTLQPVGTVIVDKLQHFLYLIQPNNVAVRYGIGLGGQCTELAGLRHVASKAEWPPWQPPPGVIERNPAPMPGGPGNPLGARLLQLDDNSSRINGTNAPKTIGTTVIFGCFRLANDDVVDLYNRVAVGAPVVVN
jgi:lipoprotein-anchoring transpeptidase ErfK/SrfK